MELLRRRHPGVMILLAVVLCAAARTTATQAGEETLAAVLAGEAPASVDELRAMQAHVQRLTEKLIPCTVAVRVGQAHGSGVVIHEDGVILTAAHVVTAPGRQASVILHDGRELPARTLGVFRTMDAGLLQLQRPADRHLRLQPATMGDSSRLAPGQWCLATGHPGGYQPDREPVVRLGRILSLRDDETIHTDCTLISGDSGGPLFDLDGHVIGIHSRIGGTLTLNLHVPVNVYRHQWDRLAASEAWGHLPGSQPYLGVQGDANLATARITQVFSGTPAADAGIRAGDVITRFAGRRITNFESLRSLVDEQSPGDRIPVELQRDGVQLQLQVTIGTRPE